MAAKKAASKKAKPVSSNYADFPDGLKYPWNRMGRLWNILWALIPIVGWLALIGYIRKIVRSIVGGDMEGLPEFGSFGDNLKVGFWVFVKLIPLYIVVAVIGMIPFVGWLANLFLQIFFVPYLVIHFLVTDEFKATFDYKAVMDYVFQNVGDYLIAFVKTLGYAIVYGVLSIVLIGIPCLYFGGYYFMAEYYAKNRP